jgi:hypothetical protein
VRHHPPFPLRIAAEAFRLTVSNAAGSAGPLSAPALVGSHWRGRVEAPEGSRRGPLVFLGEATPVLPVEQQRALGGIFESLHAEGRGLARGKGDPNDWPNTALTVLAGFGPGQWPDLKSKKHPGCDRRVLLCFAKANTKPYRQTPAGFGLTDDRSSAQVLRIPGALPGGWGLLVIAPLGPDPIRFRAARSVHAGPLGVSIRSAMRS